MTDSDSQRPSKNVLLIGATGKIGALVAETLEARGHRVLRASRSGGSGSGGSGNQANHLRVDIREPASVIALFDQAVAALGPIEAVVVAVGEVPFGPVTELTLESYREALEAKALPNINVALTALEHLEPGGSITLTGGISSREPIAGTSASGTANGALESFIVTAAAEAPRGIRINAISPNVLANSPEYEPMFVGQRPVPDEEVARAYILAVEGLINGRVLAI